MSVSTAIHELALQDGREELLSAVRSRYPELRAEDAFVAPPWFEQQRQWIEDPAGSDSAIYNFPLFVHLRGALDEDALQQSLQEITRRHGALRSVFRIMDDKLVQIVPAPQEFHLSVTDLDGLPEATRELQMHEAARAEALHPFDPAHGPMIRGKLMRLRPDEHVLQLTAHHLNFDDWSIGVFIRELSESYTAFVAGTSPPRDPIPFQYGDFVRWLDQRLPVPELESHLRFWEQQLDSPAGFEHLPLDFPRPLRSTHAGARQAAILPGADAEALKVLSRHERVSLFMTLLAGFACVLHRYSGHKEIGIASCVANRPLLEVEGLIGRFGNHVLYRSSFAGNPTFSELLKRVREVTLRASSHQELPFGMLWENGNPGSGRRQYWPAQVMFILQNAPKEGWRLPGLEADWLPLETGAAKYDLIVWLKNDPALEITLEYSTDVFNPATMLKLLSDYQALLHAMAKNPDGRAGIIRVSPELETGRSSPAPAAAKAVVDSKDKAAIEARMIQLWQAAFGLETIGVTQNFFELGGHSLLAARLFDQIQKAFHCNLPLSALLEAPTIRQLVELICHEAPSPSSLVSVQPKGTRVPLFCVHGHGGEPFFCWELSRCLGSDQPVYGLRATGHCGKPVQLTVPDMAASYVEAIRAAQPRGPYNLCGYCFGGMVAYEMAQLLTAQGQAVALLALFNTPSPGSLPASWPLNPNYLVRRTIHELKKIGPEGIASKVRVLGVKSAGLARLTVGGFKTTLAGLFTKAPLPAKRVTQGIMTVPDANIAAAKNYRPSQYPGGVTLFSTPEVSKYYATDPRLGWLSFAQGGVEYHAVEGDNGSIFLPANAKPLAEILKRCLERACQQR